MTSRSIDAEPTPIRVVLGDANVLYSRVLRDYLLYAMTQRLIRVRWSNEILAEVVKHLAANLEGFDQTSGERLIGAMNRAFPHSEIAIDPAARTIAAGLILPDENDRHVLAASVAAEADILCTNNVKDFPTETMAQLGIELMSADELLSLLVTEFPVEMVGAHELTVSRLHGASDVSTFAALRRAGAGRAANLLAELLNVATARRSTFRGERRAALRELQRSSLSAKVLVGDPSEVKHKSSVERYTRSRSKGSAVASLAWTAQRSPTLALSAGQSILQWRDELKVGDMCAMDIDVKLGRRGARSRWHEHCSRGSVPSSG